MDLGLINQRYPLILVRNLCRRKLWSDRWSGWRCSDVNWRFVWIWRKLTALVWKAIYLFREVNRNLARFNPVILEFWKRVRFSSDEFVDFAVVKRIPQNLFFV
jgi:hypothetical protein